MSSIQLRALPGHGMPTMATHAVEIRFIGFLAVDTLTCVIVEYWCPSVHFFMVMNIQAYRLHAYLLSIITLCMLSTMREIWSHD